MVMGSCSARNSSSAGVGARLYDRDLPPPTAPPADEPGRAAPDPAPAPASSAAAAAAAMAVGVKKTKEEEEEKEEREERKEREKK
jgi:hypothetical protein